ASMSKEELEVQHKRQEFISVQKSSIELAKEQGIEQGIEQGENNKAIEIAKNLLDILDDTMIAQKTGLSEQEIKILRVK
ncbi:MAG: transposase, partial [Campylobacterota bacterium]|nr:transposase [Campylobacterota bacterium]